MPVNMPTHAHGQGYTDLNFLIPELVSRIDYFKGPYYASEGDFATAGGANISYFRQMKQNLAELTGGSYEYGRALVARLDRGGPGQFLYAFEAYHDNGPWDVPENYRKYNGVLRYTLPVGDGKLGVTAMGYDGQWTATDQIPQRAVDAGADRPLRLARSERRRHQPSLQPFGRLRGECRRRTSADALPTASPTTSTCIRTSPSS